MILLLLTIALVAPYALLTGVGRLAPVMRLDPRSRAKVGVSLVFLITATGHFLQPVAMAGMLPPQVPFRIGMIYATGVLELMGALGIWVPRVSRLAGMCLILMLVGVLPANVYAALNHVPFGGHDAGPAYLLVRVPFQLLLIGWTYQATGQRWLATAARRGDLRVAGGGAGVGR